MTDEINNLEKQVDESTADSVDAFVDASIDASINEITFQVSMNTKILYDYLINHEYTSSSGILGTCFGALGILFFVRTSYPLYLIIGLMLIFYLPFNLWKQAARMMTTNPAYKMPLNYKLNSDGITVSQGEVSETAGWDACTKAVSTKTSIVLYTGKKNAFVFPRNQLVDKLSPTIAIIAENMEPKKVKIRF